MTRTARGYPRIVALATVLSALALGGGQARAEDAAVEARQQYQMGSAAFDHKKYPEAATHFEAAAALKANAVALFTAGLAWDLAQRPERAADAYARALEVPGLEARQGKTARDRLAELEKTLGTVVVTAPEGWRVQLESYSEVPTPARLHGPAGPRVLAVRIPGRPLERREVTLEAGKTANLELKDEPAAPPAEPAPAPETPAAEPVPRRLQESFWTTPRIAGVGVVGLGAASLLGTVVLGANANGAADTFEAAPTRAAYDHASSLETWTNVSLVAGVVLVAAGVALLVVPFGERSEARTSTAARLLRGTL